MESLIHPQILFPVAYYGIIYVEIYDKTLLYNIVMR